MDLKGNKEILNNHKLAFFCSQKCPGNIILKTYELAIELRNKGICVISGFHTRVEQDFLHYLLKGTQPIIICYAKGISRMRTTQLHREAFNNNRILYTSPFMRKYTRITKKTSIIRNGFVVENADEIFIAYANPCGRTEDIVHIAKKKGKKIYTFDVPENRNLIELGALDYTKMRLE